MTSVKFTINNQLDSKVNHAIEKALDVVCIDVEARAKNNCPVGVGTKSPGNLRSSITRRVEKRKGYVFTDVYYGKYVEFGTKAYVIKGNPYLVFKTKSGNWVKVKSVKHPAVKGRYFMRRALFENYKELNNKFRMIMEFYL